METEIEKKLNEAEIVIDEESSMEDLLVDFEKLNEGQIVLGHVIRVGSDEVVLDIGYKSEGVVSLREFEGLGGNLNVKVGDEVDVMIKKINGPDGLVVLSKRKADMNRGWSRLKDAAKDDQVVQGKIAREVKGGYLVDLDGAGAFLPASQVSVVRKPKGEQIIGNVMDFKIIKLDKKDIVVSHRVLEEVEQKKLREKLLDTIEAGQLIEGNVKSLTTFGAFIDLGGIDGLLHIKDMSWGRIKHPSEKVKIGETVKAKIVNFDRENGRISLSLKMLLPDPWEKVSFRYPVGEKIKGKIVSLTKYGAFVELEEGVEGLIHVSEMSWTKRINRPADILKTSQEVEAVILDVKPVERKISLGLKQITSDPWLELAKRIPTGSKIKGRVCNLTDFGAFVEIEPGIDGLIHINDLSWDEKSKKPSELLKVNDEIEVVVLNFDVDKRKIALGIKQLSDDPWKQLQRKYSVGKNISVKVVSIVDFGVFVEIEPEVEGFIHVSQLDVKRINNPKEVVKEGDELTASITKFDLKNHKINLSAKDYQARQEKKDINKYLKDDSGFFSLLGEATGNALKNHSLLVNGEQEKDEE